MPSDGPMDASQVRHRVPATAAGAAAGGGRVNASAGGNGGSGGGVAGGRTRVYSLKELRGQTELVAVSGGVYNLAKFAPHHPGGELIRAAGGTDATALFHSMHPHGAKRNLAALDAGGYRVGSLQPRTDLPEFTFDSPFAVEVRKAVADAVGPPSAWYAPLGFWLRTAVIALCVVLFEYKWACTGHWLWGALTAWMHASIGLAVQHDASHGAFAKNPTINALFSYGADWIGNSRWLWMQQHVIGHHPHTNIEGHDPDAHSAEPVLLFHTYDSSNRAAPRRWWHAFQHWFMHLVLPWYGPTLVFDVTQIAHMRHGEETPPNEWTQRQRPLAIAWRLFYLVRVMVLPWLLGGAWLPVAVLLVPLLTGAQLTYLFVVSHNFESSDRFPGHPAKAKSSNGAGDGAGASAATAAATAATAEAPVDWYKLQVETSCSYGGWLAMLFTGGLNFQIEHHLFPRLSSWHYPKIAPIVRRICDKHGVRYAYYPNLLANTASTLRYMARAGIGAVH